MLEVALASCCIRQVASACTNSRSYVVRQAEEQCA